MTTQTTKDFDELREKVDAELAKKVKPKCPRCGMCCEECGQMWHAKTCSKYKGEPHILGEAPDEKVKPKCPVCGNEVDKRITGDELEEAYSDKFFEEASDEDERRGVGPANGGL